MAAAKDKTPNYSAAQEAIIQDFYDNKGAPLDLSDAETLAADARMKDATGAPRKARSIVAKIGRMGLPYAVKVPTTKTGDPIEHKSDIVAEIGKLVKGNVAGLDKAPKPALVTVRNALQELLAA